LFLGLEGRGGSHGGRDSKELATGIVDRARFSSFSRISRISRI
jgi:hypothetical protein